MAERNGNRYGKYFNTKGGELRHGETVRFSNSMLPPGTRLPARFRAPLIRGRGRSIRGERWLISSIRATCRRDSTLGPVVAIDTETMGLQPARDRLCLVQLSGGDGDAHLVQIAAGQQEAPNLSRMLADPAVLKLFHFGRFDIAVLLNRFGVLTRPVYCTKIASRLVRTYTDRHGLKDLMRELLEVDISKQQQSSDWGATELSQAQIEYAASDVLYLHRLRDGAGRAAGARGADRARRRPASTSCRPGRGSTSPAGARSTSSRIAEGARMRAAPATRFRTGDRHRPAGDRHRGGGAGRSRRRRSDRASPRRSKLMLRGARPGDRLGHGQVGARGAQDRSDAGLDRDAGALRASGRGEPRRPRDDHRPRTWWSCSRTRARRRSSPTSSPIPGGSGFR